MAARAIPTISRQIRKAAVPHGADDHVLLKCQNRRYGKDSGKAKSALIATPRTRVFSDQHHHEHLQ
jgi:hypothetical protein